MGYRRLFIRLFTFFGGLYFFLHFLLPDEIAGVRFSAYHDQITNGFITIGTMAVGLGLINLFLFHGSKVVFVRQGWINSLALLIGLFLMIFVSFIDWRATDKISYQAKQFYILRDFSERIIDDYTNENSTVPVWSIRNTALLLAISKLISEINGQLVLLCEQLEADGALDTTALGYLERLQEAITVVMNNVEQAESADSPESAFASYPEIGANLIVAGGIWSELNMLHYDTSTTKLLYRLLFEGLFVALGSAMFALLGFYIAAAAYRAFRVRSVESGLMMIAALIVMLGQIPFGVWLWEGFPQLRLWLLAEPNTAVARAIGIGAGVAGLLMAFRMWFSIESDRFGE